MRRGTLRAWGRVNVLVLQLATGEIIWRLTDKRKFFFLLLCL